MAKPKNTTGAKPEDEKLDETAETTETSEVEAPDTSEHIEMSKQGEENILVHPAGVDEHVKLGWKVV